MFENSSVNMNTVSRPFRRPYGSHVGTTKNNKSGVASSRVMYSNQISWHSINWFSGVSGQLDTNMKHGAQAK
jgi:hypothetical protein